MGLIIGNQMVACQGGVFTGVIGCATVRGSANTDWF
jgi:hypothetical protein